MIPKLFRRSTSLLLAVMVLSSCICIGAEELYAMAAPQRTVLSNGLVLLHSEDHSLPFVTLELLVDGGAHRDPPGEEGLSYLTAKGVLLGTSRHSLAALNKELDFMGAELSASAGRDYSVLSLRVLKKDLDKAFTLFVEVLTDPSFPAGEIAREVEKTLAAIKAEEDEPEEVAEKAFRKALFLTSPYSHPIMGTKESLQKITVEKVLHYYRDYYHPNNCILAVVGDITPDEVKTVIIPPLNRLPKSRIPAALFNRSFAKEPERIGIDREITQANIIIGNAGIRRGNPDFYAASVMNYIFGGGGFASRLLDEVRNKKGLAYAVESFFDAGKYAGSFQIVLQTKNSSAREAIALVLRQMELIRDEPVTDKELDSAKKYLIGSFPLRLDTQDKLAGFLLREEYFGLGLDYPERYASLIRSVTKSDVLRVARSYVNAKNHILVVVADLKEAGLEDLSSEGPNRHTEERHLQAILTASGKKHEKVPPLSFVQHNLGITIDDLSPHLRKQYGIEDTGGVVIKKVRLDSPADLSGLREGDVIKGCDRKPVRNIVDFESAMEAWAAERDIEFLIKRGARMFYVVIATDINQI